MWISFYIRRKTFLMYFIRLLPSSSSQFCVYNSTFLFISSPPSLLLQVNFMGFNLCTLLLLLTPFLYRSYESERVHTGRELKKKEKISGWRMCVHRRNKERKESPRKKIDRESFHAKRERERDTLKIREALQKAFITRRVNVYCFMGWKLPRATQNNNCQWSPSHFKFSSTYRANSID